MALADTDGPAQLTLDAVAARAGISKGGLLHHFNTKDALLTAMVGEVIKGFDSHVRAEALRDAQAQRALTDAHIRSSFAGAGRRSRSGMALLAVAALQPALLAPMRDYMQARTRAVVQSALRPAEALAAMLIADALYLFDALGSPVVSGPMRDQVRAVALALSSDASGVDVLSPAKGEFRSAQPQGTPVTARDALPPTPTDCPTPGATA